MVTALASQNAFTDPAKDYEERSPFATPLLGLNFFTYAADTI